MAFAPCSNLFIDTATRSRVFFVGIRKIFVTVGYINIVPGKVVFLKDTSFFPENVGDVFQTDSVGINIASSSSTVIVTDSDTFSLSARISSGFISLSSPMSSFRSPLEGKGGISSVLV